MAGADPHLRSHIEAVAARGEAEAERLAAKIIGACWPGRLGDGTSASEQRWLRRWGPRAAVPEPVGCGCSAGRCQVCN